MPDRLDLSAPDTPLQMPRGRVGGMSGWLVGALVGVLVGLWSLPPVRYTLGSQLRFALAQDSLPWLRTFDTQHSLREAARLDAAAAQLPDDYLLQVGRATALVEAGGVRPLPPPTVGHADNVQEVSDHTLVRLSAVARDFLFAPGAQAHLARYLMADRVRIQRAEIAPHDADQEPARTLPARYSDMKLILWALRNGQRADPDNAFWPAMQAAAYFAAGRDQQALDALAQCGQTTRWNSYIYEEIVGQWRLYSLTYGDHGAIQKIGPLSLIAFPHLRELRHMAEMARWHADRAVANGDVETALRIRRSVRLLGHVLRENAAWAYEALYGTDLLLISASDSDTISQQSAIRTVSEWEQQARHYLAFLRQAGKMSEITVLYTEVEDSCRLRAQVDIARADASYPGIPPGIPLVALFGDWMTGVCLLQQMILLCLGMGGAVGWNRMKGRMARRLAVWGTLAAAISMGLLLFSALPSSRLAALFTFSVCLLTVAAGDTLQRWQWRRRTNQSKMWEETNEKEGLLQTRVNSDLPLNRTAIEERWRTATTLRFLFALLTPGLILLYVLRPLLSSLHPVALLLANMMGIVPETSGLRALRVGLLADAFPITLIICLCLWGIFRRVAVSAAVVLGLRRLFLPSLTCIALFYLMLLNQTLRLDAEATHAINEAAKDDLHWVLTHSEGGE